MIRAVIFDMDGVLIDSEPVHKELEQKVLAEHGVDVTKDELRQYTGEPIQDILARLKEKKEADYIVNELVHEKTEQYQDMIDDLPPMDGAVDTVKQLAEEYHVALASSSQRVNVDRIVSNLGLDTVLETTVSCDDVHRGKPHPEIFLRAAETIGVDPEQTVVIEDSAHGVEAARRGGFRVIGFQSSDQIDLSDADLVIDSMDKLEPAIRRLTRS